MNINKSQEQWTSLGDLSLVTCLPKPWTCGPEGAYLILLMKIEDCGPDTEDGFISSKSSFTVMDSFDDVTLPVSGNQRSRKYIILNVRLNFQLFLCMLSVTRKVFKDCKNCIYNNISEAIP